MLRQVYFLTEDAVDRSVSILQGRGECRGCIAEPIKKSMGIFICFWDDKSTALEGFNQ